MISQEVSTAIPQDSETKGAVENHPRKKIAAVEMKEIKDVYQTVSNTSFKTEETSDTNNLVETIPEMAETQDGAVGKAADVEAAAEELESTVQALAGPVIDEPKSGGAELKLVDAVEAAKDVGEVVEPAVDAVHSAPNEAVAASVETEATNEETTVSNDMKKDLSTDAVAMLESAESEVVVAEVNGEVKAAIDSSDEKVFAEKNGASNEGSAALAIDEEPTDKSIPVWSDISKEVAVDEDAIEAVVEDEVTVTTTSKAVENESLHEVEPVTQDMDLPVEVIATEPTVVEVVAEAIADSKTDDEVVPTELKVSAEGDVEEKAAEVTKDEDASVDEDVEEANGVQEQAIADNETETSDIEADTAVESGVKTEATSNSDALANRIAETEDDSVVNINEAVVKEKTETAPIDEDAEVVVEEAETEAAAPSAEIDEDVVKATETATTTEIAEVAVEEAAVPVAKTNEVEKKENVEAEAVENEFATEKVEETDQVGDKMPMEAAAVETAPAILKDSDDKPSPVKLSPASQVTPADDKPVEVNPTASTVSECEETESSKFSDTFEVDTKPISAVSTLIGRFEQIAKLNATEAASSRTSSRNSSRLSSPLPSPPSSWSRRNFFETVLKSNKVIENFEGPVHVESNNEEVLTTAEVDQEAAEVEKTVNVVESIDESSSSEETPAEDDVGDILTTAAEENSTTVKETETVAYEETLAATDVDGIVGESCLVKAPTVEVDAEESALEAEACTERSDAVENASLVNVEVVEQKLIEESTEAEAVVEKFPAVELEMAESSAEPEDVDLETATKEETSKAAKGADATTSETTEVPSAVVAPIEVVEADVVASETQMITIAYKATEASILSVDGLKEDAVRNEAVTDIQETAEDAAPAAKSIVDKKEAVATADFTTDVSVDSFVPVNNQIEKDSSDFASAIKEMHAIYEEIKESQGGNQKEVSVPMERWMPSISPEAPSVQTDDANAKATVEMTPTSQATKAASDDVTVAEKTPERDSSLVIPYEQLTYEILGVTRANNVIMYHIYTTNRATGEQATSISKRYSEFKLLNKQLRALNVPSVHGLPMLPKPSVGSFLRGRRCKKTIEMREKAFGDFLHYVRDHEDLHKSIVFQHFIAN